MLRRWGFRSDNAKAAARTPLLLLLVATPVLALLAAALGRLALPSHVWLAFALYPLWGVIQQFLVLGIFVGNLEQIAALRDRPRALVLIGVAVFAIVHLPEPMLVPGTAALATFYVPHFLRYRNLWPLGVVHGWLGTLYFYWVLGQDPWLRLFGPEARWW